MLNICKSVWSRFCGPYSTGMRHTKGEIKDWIRKRYPHGIWC